MGWLVGADVGAPVGRRVLGATDTVGADVLGVTVVRTTGRHVGPVYPGGHDEHICPAALTLPDIVSACVGHAVCDQSSSQNTANASLCSQKLTMSPGRTANATIVGQLWHVAPAVQMATSLRRIAECRYLLCLCVCISLSCECHTVCSYIDSDINMRVKLKHNSVHVRVLPCPF